MIILIVNDICDDNDYDNCDDDDYDNCDDDDKAPVSKMTSCNNSSKHFVILHPGKNDDDADHDDMDNHSLSSKHCHQNIIIIRISCSLYQWI